MNPRVSIIIRTKNEERWITSCLRNVVAQTYDPFEVIVVDNSSTDRTVPKAKGFNVRVVGIEDYKPGKALNVGIRESSGEIVVCLSGHCIPTNQEWLTNLVRHFDDVQVAGVYGRQQPMSYSSDRDKRDLLTVFGLDRRVQQKDAFFHNANSAIRRSLWNEIPFDEDVTNIEDRIWAKAVLERGYHIVYEPEASVYHYHGINHDANLERAESVVRVIESFDIADASARNYLKIEELNIPVIIPVKGPLHYLGSQPLLNYTLERALECPFVSQVIVATDDGECERLAESSQVSVCRRPPELSAEYVDVDDVLHFTLDEIESKGVFPDVVVLLEVTFPFRPKHFVSALIRHLVEKGLDSVLPAHREYKSCWMKEGQGFRRIDAGFLPRQFKEAVYIGLKGLGFATHPGLIREGNSLGVNVGLMEVSDPFCAVEVRDPMGLSIAEKLIGDWWKKQEQSLSARD